MTEKLDINGSSIFSLALFLAVSIVGFILVSVLVLQPNLAYLQFSMRQGLVGALYVALCVDGVLAVFYPARCQSMFNRSQNPLPVRRNCTVEISGHHPSCPNYSANRIEIKGRTICAACGGLLVGATIALVGSVLHFCGGLDVLLSNFWLFVVGEVLMFFGLAQIKFAGYVKAILNMFFVVGSFVTLVEADLLGESMLVDLFALGLITFMLWFRIVLSEWNNRRVCQECRLRF